MSSESQSIGKIYMYNGHSRMSRLSVVVALTGVKVDWVKGYGVMNAMKPPWLEKGFAMGMFPAFESADGKLRITEASAITEYLASISPESGLMPTDPVLAAQVHMWMFICEAEIIAPLTAINRGHANITAYDEAMSKGILETLSRRYANIDKWVANHHYLVGDSLTLADITMASTLGHGYGKFIDKTWREKFPEAFKYFQRILADPKINGEFGDLPVVDETPAYKPKA